MAQAQSAPHLPAARNDISPRRWREIWQGARQKSLLKNSQAASDGKWQDFYARVSRLYADVAGHDRRMGSKVCGLLRRAGVLRAGDSLLDLGCGPGTLAIPAARAGARVTALDNSRPMLAALAEAARAMGLGNLESHCRSWEEHPSHSAYDLVLACFFPQALSVAGLLRMEAWSRGHCALVLGTGQEALPFRRRIWQAVMGEDYPAGGFHLACAQGWLAASGRAPQVHRLAWPVQFRQPLSKIVSFYQSYFAIFGHAPQKVEAAVRRELAAHSKGGLVTAVGREEVAVVCWRAPLAAGSGVRLAEQAKEASCAAA